MEFLPQRQCGEIHLLIGFGKCNGKGAVTSDSDESCIGQQGKSQTKFEIALCPIYQVTSRNQIASYIA
jgi:hypothetical protein